MYQSQRDLKANIFRSNCAQQASASQASRTNTSIFKYQTPQLSAATSRVQTVLCVLPDVITRVSDSSSAASQIVGVKARIPP